MYKYYTRPCFLTPETLKNPRALSQLCLKSNKYPQNRRAQNQRLKAMVDRTQSGILAPAEGKESKNWINELPNCILSNIVSLLRLKDAVETSVVSHQWRYLWKTRPNLEFDIPNIFGDQYTRLIEKYELDNAVEVLADRFDREYYVRRVNDVLELYSGNKVDSFRVAFFFDAKSTAILDKWIRFAFAKGTRVLDLQLFKGASRSDELYVFPHWILSELDNASTLVHFSLYRCVLKSSADFNRLAQLKTLGLNEVVVNPGVLEHLVSVCVLIESLTLMNCRMLSRSITIGPLLHLKDLKVLRCCGLDKIEIDAINLSSLEFEGNILKISFMRTPLLVRFFFRGCQSVYGLAYAITLLALCPGLETLRLQLCNEVEDIPETNPAVFKNLKHLTLDLFMSKFDLSSVVIFLRAAPLLEELVITTQADDYQGEVRNLYGFLHNHLRSVKMQGFQGNRLEIELAICILNIAAKLEAMVIDPLGELYRGVERWTNCLYYQEGNEDWYEVEDVDSEEVREDENNGQDNSMDADEETQHEKEEDKEIEEGSGNEVVDENEDESNEGVDAWERRDDVDKDEHGYKLIDWERRGRAVVQERLKGVKTDAQVIIL